MSRAPSSRSSRMRAVRIAAAVLALVAASIAAIAIPLAATSTPEFFSRYHLLERRYVNLEDSAHEGIGCRACHETQATANAVALVGDFYTSLVSAGPTPEYFTFQPPTNDACLQCHADDWGADSVRTDRIPHPAHLRVQAETRSCAGCHKWTAHFEPYLDQHKEMPFSGVCVAYGCHVGTKSTEECYDCHHVLHEASDVWRTEHPAVARKTGQNACVEACHTVDECQMCHTTGERPVFKGRPIETSMRSIEELHVREDWTELYHGAEALAGRDRCLLCHQSQGECDECHLQRPAFHGPTSSWIGRHADQSTDVDDPRCLECHKRQWCVDCHEQFKEME